MKNFAHLRIDSPFYPIFPNGMCPIRNILVPDRAKCGSEAPEDIYWLDISRVSPEQLDRIANIVAPQCGGSKEEFLVYVKEGGDVPLRAIHVGGVSTNIMAFL